MRSVVGVNFKSSPKVYYYYADFECKEGDLVVVDSPSEGPVIVKVTGVDVSGELSKTAYKWLICKVDLEAYKARQVKRQEVIRLRETLENMVNNIQESKRLESILSDIPEGMELLKKLRELEANL